MRYDPGLSRRQRWRISHQHNYVWKYDMYMRGTNWDYRWAHRTSTSCVTPPKKSVTPPENWTHFGSAADPRSDTLCPLRRQKEESVTMVMRKHVTSLEPMREEEWTKVKRIKEKVFLEENTQNVGKLLPVYCCNKDQRFGPCITDVG